MEIEGSLRGKHVYLEPIDIRHASGLADASADDISLYQWSPVPQGKEEVLKYIQTAIELRKAGLTLPYVIKRVMDDAVIGSTRLWNLERWPWRADSARYSIVASEWPAVKMHLEELLRRD